MKAKNIPTSVTSNVPENKKLPIFGPERLEMHGQANLPSSIHLYQNDQKYQNHKRKTGINQESREKDQKQNGEHKRR